MSPATLRRYRAERLLRNDFQALRSQVLASVRRRLSSSGVELDRDDLEACYAMAWQGLYGAVLDGQEIASPVGWLVLVTFRRALEEHRSSVRAGRAIGHDRCAEGHEDCDLATQLDDRRTLRQLFAGLRGHLDAREREAAMLCYLHGLSRSQAAARMGVSERAMGKLMDGRGPARPGVARKVGTLVRTIGEGSWCDEQASLMRALAYGVLDPLGERHRLASLHREECPACRAYVVSLRGLAVVLPPVLSPWGIAARVLAGASGSGRAIAGTAGGAQGGAGAGAVQGAGAGSGAAAASGGSAAAGGAGGGLALAGGSAGKLAAGCLMALSVGAGCVAVGGVGRASHAPRHVASHRPPHLPVTRSAQASAVLIAGAGAAGAGDDRAESSAEHAAHAAEREFGVEQARSGHTQAAPAVPAAEEARAGRTVAGAGAPPAQSASSEQALREFAPG